MASTLASLLVLTLLAAPSFAVPSVSLLIDHGYASSGSLNIKTVLNNVSTRKGQAFHFGSTYDTYIGAQSFQQSVYNTFFNHIVAENGCKWDATEPSRGTSSLTECQAVQAFGAKYGTSFRGHNTFWHAQTPSWLPGSVSASDLVNNVIPQHVQQEVQGMGSSVTSWDVVNEVIGDGVSNGMTALQCVQQKKVWPTQTSDGSSQTLVTDLSFIHAAFSTAYKYAGSSTRLAINDYNTGGNDAKTACVIAVLKDIQSSTSIPYSRLAVGFQSHVSTNSFVSKAALKNTFATLAALGAESMITELDIGAATDSATERFQAAIWGDYLDACLYSSNCNEFINWDTRDDESWLGTSSAGTLFDSNGNPKPAAYEVAARLQHYANGYAELCATALGSGSCTVSADGTPPATTSKPATTTAGGSTSTPVSAPVTTTTSTGGGGSGSCSALYGQCGGSGWTGPTCCSSGTCQVGNPYYSQCL